MKKSLYAFLMLGLISLASQSMAYQKDCTKCGSGDSECIRIISGNGVVIYYGTPSACPD